MRHKQPGKCCICGKETELTYEHIPPKAAFNSSRIKPYLLMNLLRDNKKRFVNMQAGMGEYTICETCNNTTGAWYGAAYADFAAQGMKYYNAGATGRISLSYSIFPLRVFKQVISCFASVNGAEWCEKNPSIRQFILTPHERSFPDEIDIRMYMHQKGKVKISPPVAQMDIYTREIVFGSEWGFVPFSFICIFDKSKTNHKILNQMPSIKQFLRYRYDESVNLFLDIPRFPCNALPFDFRKGIPDIREIELIDDPEQEA